MIILFDENFPRNASIMLGYFDSRHEIRHGSDYFKGRPDTEWIAEISKWNESAIVSMDGRILKNKVERQVLKESGVPYVFMKRSWMSMGWNDFAWRIIKI